MRIEDKERKKMLFLVGFIDAAIDSLIEDLNSPDVEVREVVECLAGMGAGLEEITLILAELDPRIKEVFAERDEVIRIGKELKEGIVH